MYYSIYEILQNAIYSTTAITGWQELFLTCIASTCVLFVIAVPFIIVWKIIKTMVGR